MKTVMILLRRLHWFWVTVLYELSLVLQYPVMTAWYLWVRTSDGRVHFSIGDSHALFSFARIRHIIRLPIGPVTMHRIGRDGLQAFPLFRTHSFFWPQRTLQKGDTVFFSFGEIDCRCHINKQIESGRTEEDVISSLATAYVQAIVQERHDGVTFALMSVTPPARAADLQDFRIFQPQGSDEERSRYTRLLNEALQRQAMQHHLLYVDTYSHYKDADGMLRYPLSDGKTHISDPDGMRQLVHHSLGDDGV